MTVYDSDIVSFADTDSAQWLLPGTRAGEEIADWNPAEKHGFYRICYSSSLDAAEGLEAVNNTKRIGCDEHVDLPWGSWHHETITLGERFAEKSVDLFRRVPW